MPDLPLIGVPSKRLISSLSALEVHAATLIALSAASNGPASRAWPTANKAIYVPFELGEPVTVTKLWLQNGATASGNFDIGIYSADGTLIKAAGSTAQSGTTTIQTVDITDTLLGRGAFYMALAMNGTTGTVWAWAPAAVDGRAIGLLEQTTAFALPATATFALFNSSILPLFGFIIDPVTVV